MPTSFKVLRYDNDITTHGHVSTQLCDVLCLLGLIIVAILSLDSGFVIFIDMFFRIDTPSLESWNHT